MSDEDLAAIGLSLRVAICVVMVGLPLAVIVGYSLSRWRGAGRWLLETTINLPLVVPPVVTGYALLVLFGRQGLLGSWLENVLGLRLIFTWQAAALAALVVSFPLMVRPIRVAFDNVDMRLAQAAWSLGASQFNAWLTVTLPLAWRGVLAGAVLGFARSLGEFGATILVAGNIAGRTRTIPLAIYTHVQQADGMSRAVPLVVASVALCAVALAASGWLERRRDRT